MKEMGNFLKEAVESREKMNDLEKKKIAKLILGKNIKFTSSQKKAKNNFKIIKEWIEE